MDKRYKLDKEENDLLDSFELDEWKSISDLGSESEKYQESPRKSFRKDMRVNIRLSKRDSEAIQLRAIEEGIPYQILMGSILHKYADGRLTEKSR